MRGSRPMRCARALLVGILLWPVAAMAEPGPKDRAAEEKIAEAIQDRYAAQDYDGAEALLRGTQEACADGCSPEVKARIWMYIGVIRGNIRQQEASTREAFDEAIKLDPKVALDEGLAYPETRAVYEQSVANHAAASQAAPQPTPPPTAAARCWRCR